MNAIPYEGRGEEELDGYTDDREFEDELPRRRSRRPLLNRWSALLCALILGGIGFYAGVRVEKNQLAGSSTGGAAGGLSALRARFAGAVAGGASASGASATTGGRAGAAAGAGGFAPGGFAAAFGGGGDAIGTISSVNGSTIYVAETSGNTVKVKLSGTTKLTKSESVGKSKLYPGDSVVIAGVKGSNGTVNATTVTDSGSRSTGSSSGSGSSSSSSSGSSAVSSLFGG